MYFYDDKNIKIEITNELPSFLKSINVRVFMVFIHILSYILWISFYNIKFKIIFRGYLGSSKQLLGHSCWCFLRKNWLASLGFSLYICQNMHFILLKSMLLIVFLKIFFNLPTKQTNFNRVGYFFTKSEWFQRVLKMCV